MVELALEIASDVMGAPLVGAAFGFILLVLVLT